MQAIILSGGLGTRLHPLTLETPKPMLLINNIPLLEYQIRLLKQHGIKDIIFCTGYLNCKIEEYFGDGSSFDVSIQYREDGSKALGTAGAVKNCDELIVSESFLVLNGDILTDINLSELIRVHKWGKQPITMTMLETCETAGFGLLDYDENNGKVKKFLEKPENQSSGTINAGIYVLQKEVLFSIPDGFSMFETDVFPQFAKAGMIQGMLVFDEVNKWIDIGTHVRYNKAQEISKNFF